MDIYFFLSLITAPLAVWRIANMLSDFNQHGPGCILDRLRVAAGVHYNVFSKPETMPGSFAEALTCVYCSSIWIGLAMMMLLLISPMVTFYISLPFALSAIAIFLEMAVNYANSG